MPILSPISKRTNVTGGRLTSVLVIGGARSGKSDFACQLARKLGEPVLFVATAAAGDEEMKQRIAEHRKVRPIGWRTLEATTHIGTGIVPNIGDARVVVVDCITLLVSNILGQYGEETEAAVIEAAVKSEIDELVAVMKRVNASFVLVTNEVGLGVVPALRIGRLYRDLLGQANQMLAEHCDEVYLMVAGLPVRLKPFSGG